MKTCSSALYVHKRIWNILCLPYEKENEKERKKVIVSPLTDISTFLVYLFPLTDHKCHDTESSIYFAEISSKKFDLSV